MKGQETKHTPGPWYAAKMSSVGTVDIMPENGCTNGHAICTVHYWTADRQENADLIAAAPELLESLQLMLKSDEAIEQNRGLKSDQAMLRIAAIDQARAAVAKATQS